MACEYAREYYQVPAEIGRAVIVNGKPGVIAADRGNYIGVNFDEDKPGVISNCHPTWKVEYGGMRGIRKMTRSQERYRDYQDLDMDITFAEFLGIKTRNLRR